MSARDMTEPDAWREIAWRFAEPGPPCSGLCAAVRRLGKDGRIDVGTRSRMDRRIYDHLEASGELAWLFEPYERAVRVGAALSLALEAEGEAREAGR